MEQGSRATVVEHHYILGLLMSDITNPFYLELARGVEDAAAAHGYRVILCNTDGDLQKERAYVTSLIRGHVDGLIFASARLDDPFLPIIGPTGVPPRAREPEVLWA